MVTFTTLARWIWVQPLPLSVTVCVSSAPMPWAWIWKVTAAPKPSALTSTVSSLPDSPAVNDWLRLSGASQSIVVPDVLVCDWSSVPRARALPGVSARRQPTAAAIIPIRRITVPPASCSAGLRRLGSRLGGPAGEWGRERIRVVPRDRRSRLNVEGVASKPYGSERSIPPSMGTKVPVW